MLLTWLRIVSSLSDSSAAISRYVRFVASSRSTSVSRRDNQHSDTGFSGARFTRLAFRAAAPVTPLLPPGYRRTRPVLITAGGVIDATVWPPSTRSADRPEPR